MNQVGLEGMRENMTFHCQQNNKKCSCALVVEGIIKELRILNFFLFGVVNVSSVCLSCLMYVFR